MLDPNTTSFTWRGLYEFKENARKEVIEQYKSLQDFGKIMKIEFDPIKNTFTLTGPKNRAEEATATFVNVVGSYIDKLYSKDLGKDLNPTRGKVTRPLQTRMYLRAITWTDNLDELMGDDQDDIHDILDEITTELEAGKYEMFRKWTPTYKDTFHECFHPEKSDLVSEIAESTGCVMKVDWTTRDVHVGAPTDEVLANGLEKLSLAEQYHNWPYSRLTSHLINNDGRERFELRFIPITKQATTIGKSTLFPPSDQYSSRMGRERLTSIRLLAYSPDSDKYENVTFNCLQTYNIGQASTSIWVDYIYQPHKSSIPPSQVSQIVNDETPSGLDKGKGVVTLGSRPQNSNPKPITLPSITKDKVTGNLAFGSRPQEDVAGAEGEEADLPTLAPTRKVRGARAAAAEGNPPIASAIAHRSPSPTASLSTVGQPLSGILSGKRPVEDAEPVPLTPNEPAHGSAGASHSPTARRRVRTRNKKANSISTQGSDNDSISSGVLSSATRDTRTPRTSATRKVRATPEYQTRIFRNTQDQHAPHHKQKFDSLATIHKHQATVFANLFEKAFEDARRFCGDIRFEVRIGRIVFPGVPKKYLKPTHGFQWNNLEDELHRIGITPLFTNMLSTSPCDADYVVGIKIPGGDHLFETPPGVKTVSYEIECLTFHKIPFTIIINAETFEFEIRGKEERFGTVLWNCPTMMWDAEFCLSGHKVIHSLEAQAQLLIDSMEIEDGLEFPAFAISTKGLDFELVSGSCHRECRQMVLPADIHKGHEFTLVITENIDFTVLESETEPGAFRFESVEELEGNRKNQVWYSMHLVVDEIEEAFWKQRALRIAELADSAAKDILLKQKRNNLTTLEALVVVVSNFISKINNVGFSNEQYSLHDIHDE
ncbi:hypothetical protein DRE_04763 [Drechslerella stenobrocha 248]|uniref:Uncharacterized protein n=1 Tax=Drechslerella stenobrocha 248 TaxID=1043628 RepID=W7IAA5_9PEZI|nr:hypothetical protein DRE_04763 [Drechslerella stenobrocha 248]